MSITENIKCQSYKTWITLNDDNTIYQKQTTKKRQNILGKTTRFQGEKSRKKP